MGFTENKIIKVINKKMGERQGACQGTCLSRVGVLRQLLRNGMRVVDIDGVETKMLIQRYQSWMSQWDSMLVPQC